MLTPELTRFIGDEDELHIWWFVNGALLDLHTGYTFQAKLASVKTPATTIWTKTTGFTGAVGSGVEGNGTPNLVVQWATSGELNDSSLTAGRYILQIKATTSGAESTYWLTLNLRQRLT
jgi:hypothetical protein